MKKLVCILVALGIISAGVALALYLSGCLSVGAGVHASATMATKTGLLGSSKINIAQKTALNLKAAIITEMKKIMA